MKTLMKNFWQQTRQALIPQVVFLIVLGIFSRFVPHPWNFTALGAVALFSGAYSAAWGKTIGTYFGNTLASLLIARVFFTLLVPFSVLFLTDLYFGFYEGIEFTYLSVFLVSILGWMWGQEKNSSALMSSRNLRGVSFAVFGSFVFFFVSNYSVFHLSGMYPQSWEGLVTCYMMALPFFHWQLLGDIFYFTICAYAFSKSQVWVLASAKVS